MTNLCVGCAVRVMIGVWCCGGFSSDGLVGTFTLICGSLCCDLWCNLRDVFLVQFERCLCPLTWLVLRSDGNSLCLHGVLSCGYGHHTLCEMMELGGWCHGSFFFVMVVEQTCIWHIINAMHPCSSSLCFITFLQTSATNLIGEKLLLNYFVMFLWVQNNHGPSQCCWLVENLWMPIISPLTLIKTGNHLSWCKLSEYVNLTF